MRLAERLTTVAAALLMAACSAGPIIGAGVGAAIKKDEARDRAEEEKKKQQEVTETFTQPLHRTKSAVLTALKRMGIELTEREGERIAGKAKEHNVEIQLTAVTEKTTRMTVNVADGDKATGDEIVEQTKRALNTVTKGS